MNNPQLIDIYLSNFSLVNALGSNLMDIKNNMLLGERQGLVERSGLLNEGALYVGAIDEKLPSLKGKANYFQTRNNRIYSK